MTVRGRVARPDDRKWSVVEIDPADWAALGAAVGERVVVDSRGDVMSGEIVAVGVVRVYYCDLAVGARVRVRRAGGRP